MSESSSKLELSIKNFLKQYEGKAKIFVDETVTKFSEIQSFPNRCNVLVIGKTGVGKSTLINSIFRKQLAKAGAGEPVTQNIEQYAQDGCPITIYDTVGLEINSEDGSLEIEVPSEIRLGRGHISVVKQQVSDVIMKRKEDLQHQIHLIWYCVNSFSDRLEQAEAIWIKELAEQSIPIVLVLTKSITEADGPFLKYLKEQALPVEGIIPVLASPMQISEDYTRRPFNLQELVRVSAESLTAKIREVFIQEQIVNVELTEIEARKYVVNYAALAGAAGLIPIPAVDIPLIIQISRYSKKITVIKA